MIQNRLQLRADRVAPEKAVHLEPPCRSIISRNTTRGIEMKTCTKCHQEKPLTEFYPDRSNHGSKCGHRPQCKTCQKKQHKIYQQSAKGIVVAKRYSKTEISKARQKRYYLRYPERRQAKNAVYWAIRKNKLPHPKTLQCSYGNHKAEQYHHYKGYEPKHWLDVEPVCKVCHRKIHRRRKAI